MKRTVINPKSIWNPPIEIVNLDEMANFGIVKLSSFLNSKYFQVNTLSCIVSYNGDVSMSIKQRVKTACTQNPSNYPYDVKQCAIEFSSPGLSSEFLKLDIEKWMIKNGVPVEQLKGEDTKKTLGFADTKLSALENAFFDDNEAWKILGYKVEYEDVLSNDKVKGTVLKKLFNHFQRN